MEKQIISIVIDDNKPNEEVATKQYKWVLPFNNVRPANAEDLFFYIKNVGSVDVELETIKISSTVKASNIQVHSVYGEPDFRQETKIKPVNKKIRGDKAPNIEAYSAVSIAELTSLGQLDRLDMLTEITTYKTKPEVTITPGNAIAITCDNTGDLSGIITISTEE